MAIDAAPGLAERLLWVPRVLLYVPRRALELAFAPAREAACAWERYDIPERFERIFFNEAGTFGVYPVAFVATGFGVNAGLRVVHRDLFGAREQLGLRASFGGRFEQLYHGTITSGDRLGGNTISISAGYENGPRARFFGIGNGDEIARDAVAGRIDALVDPRAVSTRFARDLTRVELLLSSRVSPRFRVELSTELRYQTFEGVDEASNVLRYFRPATMIGFLDGTSDVWSEIEIVLDTRSRPPHVSRALASRGVLLDAQAGYARGFGGDPSDHLRYALDAEWFIDLYRGTRVLVLRGRLDGVTGELDEVPFTDLVRLGGERLLRGYEQDRFRDRLSLLGSVEYQFNLSGRATAFLFVDTGRVYREWSAVSARNLRVGFGAGLILHKRDGFLVRAQVATSKDGGVQAHLTLDPIYPAPPREEEP